MENYLNLVKSGAITAQQERILMLFGDGTILSTYQITQRAGIDRVNTTGARVGELVARGILVGVGRLEAVNGRKYNTYRLAVDAQEMEERSAYHEKQERLVLLRKVLDADFSKPVKLVVKQEIDRINVA